LFCFFLFVFCLFFTVALHYEMALSAKDICNTIGICFSEGRMCYIPFLFIFCSLHRLRTRVWTTKKADYLKSQDFSFCNNSNVPVYCQTMSPNGSNLWIKWSFALSCFDFGCFLQLLWRQSCKQL